MSEDLVVAGIRKQLQERTSQVSNLKKKIASKDLLAANALKNKEAQVQALKRKVANLQAKIRELEEKKKKYPPMPKNLPPLSVINRVAKCKKAGKVVYESEKQARKHMRNRSADLRTYPCPHCRGWHLSGRKR